MLAKALFTHFLSTNSIGKRSRVLSMLKAMRSRFLTNLSNNAEILSNSIAEIF